MVKGIKSKAFRVMLVDVDYFDEVKDYLRNEKGFSYGAGIYYKLESGTKVIYFYVEYQKAITLDIDKLPYCRVQKANKLLKKKFLDLMEISEEVWREYFVPQVPVKPQRYIDDILVKVNEVTEPKQYK